MSSIYFHTIGIKKVIVIGKYWFIFFSTEILIYPFEDSQTTKKSVRMDRLD